MTICPMCLSDNTGETQTGLTGILNYVCYDCFAYEEGHRWIPGLIEPITTVNIRKSGKIIQRRDGVYCWDHSQ